MDSDVENTERQFDGITISDKRPFKEVQNLRHESPTSIKPPRKDSHPSSSDGDHQVDEQVMFNKLVTRAKKLASHGQVERALEFNKRALRIHYTEKLAKRIKKMEAYLTQYGGGSSEEDDGTMEHLGEGFYLYREFYERIYMHQKEGLLWFWDLFRKKKGGILGDDMGLGKTIQVIGFLSGMFDMDKIKSVLIVMPVSVIPNWEKEFSKWAPGIRVTLYHGNSKREKERALAKVQRRNGVCLTSYGLVVTSSTQLTQKDGAEFVWDYVILDEGHKIKNPTKTTKGVHAIGARNRIILTGTPVQNNLRELWALFDFVHQGQLLGTARTFKMEYENPIIRSRERDATAGERRLGQEMAESLKKIIEPFFLRRTKAEVTDKKNKGGEETEDGKKHLTKMPSLGRKNDFVVWVFLKQTQLKIYEDFLALDSVKELLMTSKSPLVALTVLKKICDHPRLLSSRACAQLGLDGEEGLNTSNDTPSGMECAANKINHIDDEVLIGESGKLLVLVDLLDNLKSEGHRCLIFSQSRKMLDIIQKIVTNRGHKVMRLDGTVTQLCERDQRIQKFQGDSSFSVFLLTTQVGGVGLTLTAADRVVIYDPSWNPATDAQAVDRVFRIGQNKNVVVYRLITCGSVEEKIYRRQIFKDSITRQTTGNSKNPYRYFTKGELRELFTLDDSRFSKTQRQLQDMHGVDRRSDPSLDSHIAYLHALEIFGVSDHDLMFSQEHADDVDSDAEHDTKEVHSNDYILHRVQKAQELLQMESSLSSTLQERMGQYPRNCDVNNRAQRKSPTGFFQPKQYDQKPNRPKGSSDYDSDVPLPATVDLTVMDDDDDESPVEVLDSPVKVKVERSPVIQGQNGSDTSLIEILDSPVKVKSEHLPPVVKVEGSAVKTEVKVEGSAVEKAVKVEHTSMMDESKLQSDKGSDMYEADVSMTEDDESSPTKDFTRKDASPISDDTEYDSCEEELNAEADAAVNNHRSRLEDHLPNAKDALSNEIDHVIDRIDQNMSITLQPDSDDGAGKTSGLDCSQMNATCERLEDYLSSSDKETELSDDNDEGLTTTNKPEAQQLLKVKEELTSPKEFKYKKLTPMKKRPLVVEEHILISPEPASPLMELKAKRQRNHSKTASPAQFLSRTLMSCASDSPETPSSTSSSHSDRLEETFVEDSPACRKKLQESLQQADLPRIKALKSFHVVDSVENTPVVEDEEVDSRVESSICDDDIVRDSDKDTPVKKNRRRSVCKRNIVIESSDEEDEEQRSSSAELAEKSEMRLPESDSENDELPDLGDDVADDPRGPAAGRSAVGSTRTGDDSALSSGNGFSEVEEGDVEKSLLSEDEELEEGDVEKSLLSEDEELEEGDVEKSLLSEDEEAEAGPADDRDIEGSEEEEEDEVNSDDDDFIDDDEEEFEETGDEEEGSGSSEEEEDQDDLNDLSPQLRAQFDKFVQRGRTLYLEGQHEEALANVLQALEIHSDSALQAMALKMHQDIAS
ncbi:DNA excision repair protein ERCC-6-like [Haliotis rufescens]|uniref:DNA excision repair protein ERCC-6-like n=1 Tax=Haliotis rufescens TaxID=6454 RepID=UPI00201EEE32|nr:DNA excision repair protein ERCC-6-like [Haliotis rufescens]